MPAEVATDLEEGLRKEVQDNEKETDSCGDRCVDDSCRFCTKCLGILLHLCLHLGEKVTFDEGPSEDGNKLITLTVDEDSDDVFVRVKVFAVKEVLDNLTYKDTSKWTESAEDDSRIYTYNTVLSAGDTVTLELIVDAEKTGLKEFNLVVVYEYCPAIDGAPDWTGENIHIIEDADQNGGN